MQESFEVAREVVIRAPRSAVFRYFTDSERFARWWGEGSSIDPRPGGAVRICYPGGVLASGEVLELESEVRIVFSYGYEDPQKPIPPAGSRISVHFQDDPRGTRVALRHEVADAASREMHVQGWRYQLAVFAAVVAAEVHAEAGVRIDGLLSAWGDADEANRRRVLEQSVTHEVEFRDAYSCTRGLDDLDAHMAAAAIHMPGVRLHRVGEVRQCQGVALAGWEARDPEGQPKGKGQNVFELAPDGRIRAATGFWER
jgi:uncharacterized protein YndB with AHSA1/START domain